MLSLWPRRISSLCLSYQARSRGSLRQSYAAWTSLKRAVASSSLSWFLSGCYSTKKTILDLATMIAGSRKRQETYPFESHHAISLLQLFCWRIVGDAKCLIVAPLQRISRHDDSKWVCPKIWKLTKRTITSEKRSSWLRAHVFVGDDAGRRKAGFGHVRLSQTHVLGSASNTGVRF